MPVHKSSLDPEGKPLIGAEMTRLTKLKWKVHFENGKMHRRVDYWQKRAGNYKEVSPYVFGGTLKLLNWEESYNKSKYIILQDTTSKLKYTMEIKEFIAMLKKADMIDGCVSGFFTFQNVSGTVGLVFFHPPMEQQQTEEDNVG